MREKRRWFGTIRKRLNLWVTDRKEFLVDYNKLDFDKEYTEYKTKLERFVRKCSFISIQFTKVLTIIEQVEETQEEIFGH